MCFLDSTHKSYHRIFVFVWLIFLSIMTSKYIHVAADGKIPFFLWLSSVCVWVHCIFLVHSSIDGHLGCFHILAIVNNALWTLVCMYLYKFGLERFSKSAIAGTYGNFVFSFFRNLNTDFHNLHSYQQSKGFPFLHILASICYLCSFWWLSFWQVWDDSSLWS